LACSSSRYLYLSLAVPEMLDELGDEGARARSGIEDLHVLVDQPLAEVTLAQPVGTLDHEAHDFVRGVDDTQPVGRLGVVDLVEFS